MAGSAARADSSEQVMARLAALEKENAAIRKENAALRANKALRAQNATLKSSGAHPAAADAGSVGKRDPFAAYAADLPAAYKARPVDRNGQFRVWGEGGAIWSGGGAPASTYDLAAANPAIFQPNAGSFDLLPKVGWQAAAGFDYRFAESPWHVSGQFRYWQNGRASGNAVAGGAIEAQLLAPAFGPGTTGSSYGSINTDYQESQWLADAAIGRDVLGSGASAMQLKAGLRVAEVVGKTSSLSNSGFNFNFGAPLPLGAGFPPFGSAGSSTSIATQTRSSFLGAGPRIGVEGSVPLAGSWAFDYAGDAAVLFGYQRLTSTATSNTVLTPAILGLLGGAGSSVTFTTDQHFATVFNADLQVGVSYWMTPNVKLSASYRLDAYFNVLNQTFGTASRVAIDRYVHGPQLGISATF
ncbi:MULTISPECIES: Lpg1974 family pore-forming outer membrane protein [Rhodopseudomonas]|nr:MULTISPECIES: Lpg1974 family pore-forming outer membrane protein [Rhodopseudomonas]MDF3813127.1 Lpg1974 family pore-forming outer membrane protein [Rhodopseudomonas sp. BAL398]